MILKYTATGLKHAKARIKYIDDILESDRNCFSQEERRLLGAIMAICVSVPSNAAEMLLQSVISAFLKSLDSHVN